MHSPSVAAPQLPPAPIESLAAADKELKELLAARGDAIDSATASSRTVAAGRSGVRTETTTLEQAQRRAAREFDTGYPYGGGHSKRIEQLQKYIEDVMSTEDKARRETPRGRASNILIANPKRKNISGTSDLLSGASRTLLNG